MWPFNKDLSHLTILICYILKKDVEYLIYSITWKNKYTTLSYYATKKKITIQVDASYDYFDAILLHPSNKTTSPSPSHLRYSAPLRLVM